MPIAVKDDIALTGQVATKGSRVRAGGPPAAADAEPLRRLRAAGAIPIGITNVPELMIFPWTASAAYGITRNPWDPSRTPGGSSGGSAAAVAAGLVAAATASDGGGSIRIPAACCGLVGMKPSRGRVSAAPGRPGWLGLSTYGALARTVADSALLLDVIHGTAAGEDDLALPRSEASYAEAAGTPPRPLRIAVSTKAPPIALTSPGAPQRAVHEGTARLLEQLGHHVSERDPDYGTAPLQFTQSWVRGVYEDAAATGRRGEFERSTRQMAAAGRYLVPPPRRRRLLRVRPLTTERITALWDEFDVLMTPALASAPVAAEGGYGRAAPVAVDIAARMTPYTAVFNLTGQPAVTVPLGVDGEGLPIAVQLVGRLGGEDVLYSLAGQLERAAPWGQRRPVVS